MSRPAPAVATRPSRPVHGFTLLELMIVVAVIGLLAVLFAITELVTIDIELRHESVNLSFSWVPLLVGLTFLAPWVVLAMKLVATVFVLVIVHRQPVFKFAVNLCAAIAEVQLVTLVLHLAPDAHGPARWGVLLLAAIVADLAVGFLVATAISIFEGRWETASTRSILQGIPFTVLGVAYAALLTALIAAQQPEAALAVLIGALIVALLRAHTNLTTRHRQLRLLDDFTRALGRAATEGNVTAVLLRETAEVLHADGAFLVIRDGDEVTRLDISDGYALPRPAGDLERILLRNLTDEVRLFHESGPVAEHLDDAGPTEAMAARLDHQVRLLLRHRRALDQSLSDRQLRCSRATPLRCLRDRASSRQDRRRSDAGGSTMAFATERPELARNRANYVPLTPVSFLVRAARFYPERTAIVHGESPARVGYREFLVGNA